MMVGVKEQMSPPEQNYSSAAWTLITVLVSEETVLITPRLTDLRIVYMPFFMHILRQNEAPQRSNLHFIIKGTYHQF